MGHIEPAADLCDRICSPGWDGKRNSSLLLKLGIFKFVMKVSVKMP